MELGNGQKLIDSESSKKKYYSYNMDWIANMENGLDTNNSVIKKLCIINNPTTSFVLFKMK